MITIVMIPMTRVIRIITSSTFRNTDENDGKHTNGTHKNSEKKTFAVFRLSCLCIGSRRCAETATPMASPGKFQQVIFSGARRSIIFRVFFFV